MICDSLEGPGITNLWIKSPGPRARSPALLEVASPSTGYTAKDAGWIRVDLTKAEHGTAVFCPGGERRTDTWTY